LEEQKGIVARLEADNFKLICEDQKKQSELDRMKKEIELLYDEINALKDRLEKEAALNKDLNNENAGLRAQLADKQHQLDTANKRNKQNDVDIQNLRDA